MSSSKISNDEAPTSPAAARSNALRLGLAELVGTFLLVLVGTSVATAAILGRQTAGAAYDSLATALSFGLVLAALVAALGQSSGCHVNPAVTVGLAVTGKFPWRQVPMYILAQLVGAVLAALALWAATANLPAPERLWAPPHPAPGSRICKRS